jgi:hypothetical protein
MGAAKQEVAKAGELHELHARRWCQAIRSCNGLRVICVRGSASAGNRVRELIEAWIIALPQT